MAELNVRVYVVEAMPDGADPNDKSTVWPTIHTTEDHHEAIRVAKEESGKRGPVAHVRVRQFWLARTITVRDTLTKAKPNVIIPDAQLTMMTCMDHPEVTLRWMPDGLNPPECSICHKPLVTQALVDSMSNPVDLSET